MVEHTNKKLKKSHSSQRPKHSVVAVVSAA